MRTAVHKRLGYWKWRVATQLCRLVRPNQGRVWPKETWEAQYRGGHWDRLRSLDELAHYSVIAGYCRYLKPGGIVLDIGCGEGILLKMLGADVYSHYVGIDLASEAISRAAAEPNSKAILICADASTYVPELAFDVIVFNEVLYYFEKPLETVNRYTHYLVADGILLVSMYRSRQTRAICKRLRGRYSLIDQAEIVNGQGVAWDCLALRAVRGD